MFTSKASFEIREIDAWADPDGGWTWNETYVIVREFESAAEDLKRMFLRKLQEARGRPLPKGVFYVDDSDWDIIEIKRRSDECPIWAMLRTSHER